MADRYFVARPITTTDVLLDGPEAHHLIHVMRARPGASVVLFDGSGAEFPAIVEQVGRNEVRLRVASRQEINRELPRPVTLGVALPKGDRQKWLVEKAVELGVSRLVPLQTARSVAEAGPQAIERLRRTVVEASKQSGRNRLMEITAPASWADFVTMSNDVPLRLLAHPHGCVGWDKRSAAPPDVAVGWAERSEVPPNSPDLIETVGLRSACPTLQPRPSPQTTSAFLAVGPEGGFTDDEVASAVATGWQTIDLGPRILRIETAAMLLVAAVIFND